MVKKQYCISIDPEVWDLAKIRIDNMSLFIERQLDLACNSSAEITVLEKELNKKEQEVIALRTRLCSLRDKQSKELIDNDETSEAMVTIHNIVDGHGFVGKNQIKAIADLHKLSFEHLLNECVNEDMVIREVFEPYKERVRNPVSGKY